MAYFGLYAQQHRGQESAGIVTIDEKGLLHEHKGMGLVPDVFAEANLQALPGTISLGHVRYSTTGRSAARNAQPFVAHYKGLDIAIAHNGNLVNTMELREELENDGAIFSTTNDTEVFMHLIVRALREHDLVDAIREACARVRGAYCLLVYACATPTVSIPWPWAVWTARRCWPPRPVPSTCWKPTTSVPSSPARC